MSIVPENDKEIKGSSPVVMRFTMDENEMQVASEHLENERAYMELMNAFKSAVNAMVVLEPELVDIPLDIARAAIQLLHTRDTVQYCDDRGYKLASLLHAIAQLHAFDPNELERNNSHTALMHDAIALGREEAIDNSCQTAHRLLKGFGYKIRQDRIATIVRQRRKEMDASAACENPQLVRTIWPDAPVSPEAIVPRGWRPSEDGVRSSDGKLNILTPLVITETGEDCTNGIIMCCVSARLRNAWRTTVLPRGTIASAHAVLRLADHGIDCTSNNAAAVVAYLASYQQSNDGLIPHGRFLNRLGWIPDTTAFLLGDTVIDADGVHMLENDESNHVGVRFRPGDVGDHQVARGFRGEGSLERWVEAITPMSVYPRVMLGVFASLAAPMLHILNSPNGILSYECETSLGKSTVQQIAASVWGNPAENEVDSAFRTWNCTTVNRERLAAVLNGLPLILDDTSVLTRDEDIEAFVFTVVRGQGKGRGSIAGLASQDAFRTILISSGETPLASHTNAGGTRARILSCSGEPFGPRSDEVRLLIASTKASILTNYGMAGPKFLHYLCHHKALWAEWREEYSDKISELANLQPQNAIAGRLAAVGAAISIAARHAHAALEMPGEFQDPVDILWDELIGDTYEADRAALALAATYALIVANDHRIINVNGHKSVENVTVLGIRISGQNGTPAGYGLMPEELKGYLASLGYKPDAILRSWRNRGWLAVDEEDGGGRCTKKQRIGRSTSRVIFILQSALDGVSESTTVTDVVE